MLRKIVLVLTISLCTTPVYADVVLHLHMGSKHYVSGDFNETNPGLGLGYYLTDRVMVAGGFYENSFYENSAYVSIVQSQNFGRYVDVRYGMMAISGYRKHLDNTVGGILPTPLLQIRICHVSIMTMPSVIGFGIEIPF